MSFAQRESVVLAALLLVVAALIPSFIQANEPKVVIQADPSSSPLPPSHFQFQWHWITTTLGILATPLQIILVPLQAILSFVYAVLYPLVVAFRFVFGVVMFPITLMAAAMKMLYPIYVFLGAACVLGLMTAYISRILFELCIRSWGERSSTESAKELDGRTKERGRNMKRKDVAARTRRRSFISKVER